MSRPIVMTDEIKNNLIEQFAQAISGAKMFDGEFKFQKKFTYDDGGRATVSFTPEAYLKMLALVQSFTSEVGWHGLATRVGDGSDFLVSDILVYPQEVTGTNVNTDQEEYTKWLYSHDDEVFKSIRFQGHSHVNMSTTPSAVDMADQEAIMRQLKGDMFYIFLIINKKLEHTIKVFDLKHNTLFETSDVDLNVGDTNWNEFVESAKKMVKPKTYTAPATYTGMSQPGVGVGSGAKSGSKRRKNSYGSYPYGNSYYDGEDDLYERMGLD